MVGKKSSVFPPKAVVQNYGFLSGGELQLFTPAFQTYLQNPAVQSRDVTDCWLGFKIFTCVVFCR